MGIHPGWFRLYDAWCESRFDGELDAATPGGLEAYRTISGVEKGIVYQPPEPMPDIAPMLERKHKAALLEERTIYQGPRDQNGAGHAKVGSPFVAHGVTWRVTRIDDGSWFDSRWPGETEMRRLYGVRIS